MYPQPIVVRMIKSRGFRWAGHVSRIEEDMNAFNILTGALTGKRPSGRSRSRCEGNIRMYLKEIGINTRNWIDLS